jgi:hypothetical protein
VKVVEVAGRRCVVCRNEEARKDADTRTGGRPHLPSSDRTRPIDQPNIQARAAARAEADALGVSGAAARRKGTRAMRLQGPARELLWKLTDGWPPKTLTADNLDDPAVHHLRANDLAEVTAGRLQATQAGYDLRAMIEHQEL